MSAPPSFTITFSLLSLTSLFLSIISPYSISTCLEYIVISMYIHISITLPRSNWKSHQFCTIKLASTLVLFYLCNANAGPSILASSSGCHLCELCPFSRVPLCSPCVLASCIFHLAAASPASPQSAQSR